MTAFDVKCHSTHVNTLLLTRSSLRSDLENYDSFQYVPYNLAQVLGEKCTNKKLLKNAFLHNIAIIPVHNIDADTMYSDIIPKSRKIGSIKGFEPTFLSDARGKCLLITTKSMKP